MEINFKITPKILRYIQDIERIRETIRLTSLPNTVVQSLSFEATIRSAHYSTRIEGNRLTLKQTEEVVLNQLDLPGRERDIKEVEYLFLAHQHMERWADNQNPISEEKIKKLHALLYRGKKAKPTEYRDGQNVIRDSKGGVVYMPPEAKDVGKLMTQLVAWINKNGNEYPVPIVAGIAHYQLETIHPFYDGNGRLGRLLTTWVLYQGGYGLGKYYSLEEYYANDLAGYYRALDTHPHHNYYFGRNEADITSWVLYFLQGVSIAFRDVLEKINSFEEDIKNKISIDLIRKLDSRGRKVVSLFASNDTIQSSMVSGMLGISPRQTRTIMAGWVSDGWLEIINASKKGRKYQLAKKYILNKN